MRRKILLIPYTCQGHSFSDIYMQYTYIDTVYDRIHKVNENIDKLQEQKDLRCHLSRYM